jgi:heat-inducible transcriptional repressor
MQDHVDLEKRRREILGAIVRQYIASGVPVGSKAVAASLPESLSSATIRNCMAELEAAGFLSQPHISAGRVPTDKAYRFYVDSIMGPAPLGADTEKYIDQALGRSVGGPEQLMASTSRVLAEISHHVGLVLGPASFEKVLEHIKFVKLSERRLLVVIVSRPDLIENKVVRLDEEVSQAELDRSADYLNSEFQGWSLRAIRVQIFKRLEEMKSVCDRLLSNIAELFSLGALAGDETGEENGLLFVDGTSRIAEAPEFDLPRIRHLLAAFEQKARLVRILNACLPPSGAGVRTLIGRENPESDMQQCALIVAPFHYRHHAVGALGVMGPTRMEYDRAIRMVEYVAQLCSKLLSVN